MDEDELFLQSDPRHATVYGVQRLTVGYIFDVPIDQPFRLGIGASGTFNWFPEALESEYGESPHGFTVFVRTRLSR